jgi:hypothetical protein
MLRFPSSYFSSAAKDTTDIESVSGQVFTICEQLINEPSDRVWGDEVRRIPGMQATNPVGLRNTSNPPLVQRGLHASRLKHLPLL